MNRVLRFLPALAVIAVFGTAAVAQQPDLKAEIEALKKGQEAIQKDVAEIKKLLEDMRPKPPKPFEPLDVSLNGAPMRGQATSKVTIVEFTDYQCPFCRRHVDSVLPQLAKEYIEGGKVRYFLRDFPLASIHPRASKAAQAALCAGDQGKYWEMHETLFANQRKLGDADLLGYGKQLGLEEAAFKKCLDDSKYEQKIQTDVADGAKAGVSGTPSFFLGLTDPKDNTKIRATKFLRGAQPAEAFKKAIDELLAGGGEKPTSGSQ
jgi:protein-disulfide isomerase